MRKLTLAAVTAAHLFAIVWIDQITRTRKSAAREEPPPLVVFFLNARREDKQTDPLASTPAESPSPAISMEPRQRQEAKPPEPSPPTAQPSTAITDWAEQARAAAEDHLKRERAKSQLRAFSHDFAQPEEPEKSGVFGLQKRNRHAGMIEPGWGGTERHWVTDNCYFEFPRGAPPPPPMAGDIKMNGLRCKPDPTGGGEHMFDHLKPEYLKPPPPKPAQ